jgi:hypothetical protein
MFDEMSFFFGSNLPTAVTVGLKVKDEKELVKQKLLKNVCKVKILLETFEKCEDFRIPYQTLNF